MDSFKRFDYLDMLKGLGILGIVLCHARLNMLGFFCLYVSNFMITVFFFCCGYLHAIRGNPVFLKAVFFKRLRSLFWPYVIFSIIIFFFDFCFVFLGIYPRYVLFADIFKTFSFRGIGTLWFLPALFGGELLFCIVNNLKNQKFKIVIIITMVALLFFIWLFIFKEQNIGTEQKIFQAPFLVISHIICAVVYIYEGFLFAKIFHSKIITAKRMCLFFIAIVLLFLNLFFVNSWDMNLMKSSNLVLSMFSFALCPIGVFLFAFFLSKFKCKMNVLTFLGRNSLIVMLTHYSIVYPILREIRTHINVPSCLDMWDDVIIFILVLLIEVPVIYLINFKFKWLLKKDIRDVH